MLETLHQNHPLSQLISLNILCIQIIHRCFIYFHCFFIELLTFYLLYLVLFCLFSLKLSHTSLIFFHFIYIVLDNLRPFINMLYLIDLIDHFLFLIPSFTILLWIFALFQFQIFLFEILSLFLVVLSFNVNGLVYLYTNGFIPDILGILIM
jgi:hypothetical protein